MNKKLLFTADLHGNKDYYALLFERVKKDDVKWIVLGGDLCPRGGETLEEWTALQRTFIEEYLFVEIRKLRKEFPDKQWYAIMGNDDFRVNAALFEQADKDGLLHFIHKKNSKLTDSLRIAGYSFVNTTPFRLKDWDKADFKDSPDPEMMFKETIRSIEEEQGTIWEDLNSLISDNEQSTILVMHAPPHNTNLDMLNSGDHVGSQALRRFIEEKKPLLTLHGHIHESPGVSGSWMDSVAETICVNVGSHYPTLELPVVLIDLEQLENMQYEVLS